jgi:hypothetical protein
MDFSRAIYSRDLKIATMRTLDAGSAIHGCDATGEPAGLWTHGHIRTQLRHRGGDVHIERLGISSEGPALQSPAAAGGRSRAGYAGG